MNTFYDSKMGHYYTEDGLRQRGLSLDTAVLSVAGIYPVRYIYPAYDARLYTIEPKAVMIEDGMAWQEFDIVPVNLDVGKKVLLELVQQEKVRMRDGGITVNDLLFDTDERAQAAYTKLAVGLMLDQNLSVPDWKASAGVWVDMDATLFIALKAALAQHEASVFTWQRQKEAEIAACETIAALENVSIEYAP